MLKRQIIVVGGGAAGYFAAIACAEADPTCEVTIYEATAHLLSKVRVSGGGRCNVTHACFDPRELAKRYPRGSRELLGAFSRWQPRDTVAWFDARGVALKTESDGRMFPVTDSSQTIIDCLQDAAEKAGVKIEQKCSIKTVEKIGDQFRLTRSTGGSVMCDQLLLATGGGASNGGHAIARQFGHTIEPPVPSLFTFHVTDPRLADLSGVSVDEAVTSVVGSKLKERGPLLVTHWGLSGPAVLKLSAWGARELHTSGYRFTLRVNWAPTFNVETARAELERARIAHPKKQLSNWCPLGLPLRLWEKLLVAAGLTPTSTWTTAPGAGLRALAMQVVEGEFAVTGKSMFKDEFVTCGGVRLSEVDFKTMESRLIPGLYFSGEVLDIDGITGGYNFQNAWTTGWLAGRAMAGAEGFLS